MEEVCKAGKWSDKSDKWSAYNLFVEKKWRKRGQWEQGCGLFMATDLDPVRATRKKK